MRPGQYRQIFLLLATHGHHPFYDDEGESVQDARRVPIMFMGNSISVQKGGFLRKTGRNAPAIRDHRWRVSSPCHRIRWSISS